MPGVPGATGSPRRVKSPLMKITLSRGCGSSDMTSVVMGLGSRRSRRASAALLVRNSGVAPGNAA